MELAITWWWRLGWDGKSQIGIFQPSTDDLFQDVNSNGKFDRCRIEEYLN